MTNVLAGATNVSRSDFIYDGRMRRRERFESALNGAAWLTNTGVFYVYDGNVVVQERNGGNLPVVTYTRGRDLSGTFQGAGGVGGLLARTDNSVLATLPLAAHAYYHADGNGNITCLINSSNAVMARYLYDPFGRILSQSGSLAAANLYRFSSKEFHVNSGMYYYLYRFYDSSLQRWLNTDPLEEAGGLNLYGFVANNPTTRSDPLGLLSPACARAMQELANASANFGAAPGPLTSYALNEAIDAAVAACGPESPANATTTAVPQALRSGVRAWRLSVPAGAPTTAASIVLRQAPSRVPSRSGCRRRIGGRRRCRNHSVNRRYRGAGTCGRCCRPVGCECARPSGCKGRSSTCQTHERRFVSAFLWVIVSSPY